MGYDLALFDNPQLFSSLPNLICRLCFKVLEKPTETSCGFIYCFDCIYPYSTCPGSGKPIFQGSLRPSLGIQNILATQEMKCDKCSYHGTYNEFPLHNCQSHLKVNSFI